MFNQGSSQEMPGKIRLITDISAKAFWQKRTKELALWNCLRSLNSTGSGKIDSKRAISGLQRVFHYSISTIYEHLARGEGTFWHTVHLHNGRTRIDLQGVLSASKALSITRFTNTHFVEGSVADLDSTDKRRSQIYASIHHPKGIKLHPISRASIEEFTGISKPRQRRLEKLGHVRRFATYAVTYNNETEHCEPRTMRVYGKSRSWTIQQRLPNMYQSTKLQPGPHGCLKNVDRLVRSFVGREGEGEGEPASELTKVFFNTYYGLVKALAHSQDGATGYARVTPQRAVVRGRQEWALVQNRIEPIPNNSTLTGRSPEARSTVALRSPRSTVTGTVEFEAKYEGCRRGRYYR